MNPTVLIQVNGKTGERFQPPDFPSRIVSLVPSQTELLFDLGLEDRIVGITKFCNRPAPSVKSKAKIGGTKNLNIEKIIDLKPDLIIGNKEENVKDQVETLASHFPVFISEVITIEDSLRMVEGIGHLTKTKNLAESLAGKIKLGFESLPDLPIKSVAYLIWKKPIMAVGPNTFIHSMLEKSGFVNVFANSKARYPETTMEELSSFKPQVVFLSDEPFPFKTKDIEPFRPNLKDAEIKIVDGTFFSWYGSRLVESLPEISLLLKSLH